MSCGDLAVIGAQQLGMLTSRLPNERLKPYAEALEGLPLWLLEEDVQWTREFFRKFIDKQVKDGLQWLLLDHLGLLAGGN